MTSDSAAQAHWIRRLVALIIDGMIVDVVLGAMVFFSVTLLAITAIILDGGFPFFLLSPFGWLVVPFVGGFLSLLYFAVASGGL